MESHLSFSEMFFGSITVEQWLYAILLMFMGITSYILLRIHNRKDQSSKPSIKKYFSFYKNRVHLYLSIILTYLLIRFYSNYESKLLSMLPEWLKVTTPLAMVLLGFFQHSIIEMASKKVKEKNI